MSVMVVAVWPGVKGWSVQEARSVSKWRLSGDIGNSRIVGAIRSEMATHRFSGRHPAMKDCRGQRTSILD